MNLLWWGGFLGGGGPPNPYTPPPDDSEFLWVSDVATGGEVATSLIFDPTTLETAIVARLTAEAETTGAAIATPLTTDPAT